MGTPKRGWISNPPPKWGIILSLRWIILRERKRSDAMGRMVVVVVVVVVCLLLVSFASFAVLRVVVYVSFRLFRFRCGCFVVSF